MNYDEKELRLLLLDAATFDVAADYIESHGWIRNNMKTPEGVCTIGAITEAAGISEESIPLRQDEVDRLVTMYMEHTGILNVPMWNDLVCTNELEAVANLRMVARSIRRVVRLRMGNIGEPKREIEFEPMPATEPIPETVPEPVKEPETQPA